MRPRLIGLPYLADRATRLGGLPHLSCKHDQIKMRYYMERRVTPPRRVTSPTWGPPPPCKQALKFTCDNWRWILIGDDRNLSMHRQRLMRFKKSFSLLSWKVKKLFLPCFLQNIYLSLLNLNSKKYFFPFFVKIHLPWYLEKPGWAPAWWASWLYPTRLVNHKVALWCSARFSFLSRT